MQLSYAKLATKPQWNHFHFIGHSLGAHLSGIAAANLKVDPFYQIERITGLDPAQPCFKNIDLAFRLDPSDADYVDVIHTQMGKTEGFFASFGIRDPIGCDRCRLNCRFFFLRDYSCSRFFFCLQVTLIFT
uniref:phospholipase A1 n=1 Tax=Trichogramma kaykai TaxID=54128 RepID=A0ABD2X1Z0_9HYME